MSIWNYWSHGGSLTPNSLNLEVNNLQTMEDEKIRLLASKMVTDKQLRTAIQSQDTELTMLKDSMCVVTSHTVNSFRITELKMHYNDLASKIENTLQLCSQNTIPSTVHHKLLQQTCLHLNPGKVRPCSHPEILNNFGCQVEEVRIGEEQVVVGIKILIPKFVNDVQTSYIIAFPYKLQNGDLRVLDSVPEYISITHKHLFISKCIEKKKQSLHGMQS